MSNLSEAAKEARRAYKREYRRRNLERVRQQDREWRKNNPDKVQAIKDRYWEKKAAAMSDMKEGQA